MRCLSFNLCTLTHKKCLWFSETYSLSHHRPEHDKISHLLRTLMLIWLYPTWAVSFYHPSNHINNLLKWYGFQHKSLSVKQSHILRAANFMIENKHDCCDIFFRTGDEIRLENRRDYQTSDVKASKIFWQHFEMLYYGKNSLSLLPSGYSGRSYSSWRESLLKKPTHLCRT